MRHKCRMAAIETEANAKIRKSLIGRSRPMRQETVCIKDKVSGWDQLGSLELKDWVSHRATAIMCAKGTAAYVITRRARNARDGGDDPDERALQTWCTQTTGSDTTAAIDNLCRKNNSHHHNPRLDHTNKYYERIHDNSNFIQDQDHR